MSPLVAGGLGYLAGKFLGGGEDPSAKRQREDKEFAAKAEKTFRKSQKENARLLSSRLTAPEDEEDEEDDDDDD